MGYNRTSFKPEKPKLERQHPIWRGIGCLMIIVIPVLSYAIAWLILPMLFKSGLVPTQLTGQMYVPEWLWVLPVVAGLVQRLIGFPNLKALLILTFVNILIISGIMSMIYALIYRMFGPPKYGPMDAPPPKVKVKKYRR